ncbi:MAG: glycoside hydrolase family 88 protein [Reichenbachiella sp.]
MKLQLTVLLILIGTTIFSQSIDDKKSIKEVMLRTNAYQLENPWRAYDNNWIRGTYYTGVMACYLATDDEIFLNQCDKFSESLKWSLPAGKAGTAGGGGNLLTCGQTMIESYLVDPEFSKIKNIIAHLENPNLKNPIGQPMSWHYEDGRRYVDAIFTGPPTLAMLYKATGNEKYLQWMDHFVWDIYGHLFDDGKGLFYRDFRFRDELIKPANLPEGSKIVWSRGNGWAFAGMARILQYLPEEHGSYNKFVITLQTIAKSLKACQSEEGFWYPNLDDANHVRLKETSGTSFFIYGLAYGINNDILDKKEYLPVVEKAWASVYKEVSKKGKVQWGQLVGESPENVKKEHSHEYVTGTFLLAASEVYKLKR